MHWAESYCNMWLYLDFLYLESAEIHHIRFLAYTCISIQPESNCMGYLSPSIVHAPSIAWAQIITSEQLRLEGSLQNSEFHKSEYKSAF